MAGGHCEKSISEEPLHTQIQDDGEELNRNVILPHQNPFCPCA